jgi:hypothetical protein
VTTSLGRASVPWRMGSSCVPPLNGGDTLSPRLTATLRRVGRAALLNAIAGLVREGYPGRGDVHPTAASSGQVALEDALQPAPPSPATPPGGWFAEGIAELEAEWQSSAEGWLYEEVKEQLNGEIAQHQIARAKVTLGEVVRRNIAAKKRYRSASRPLMLLRVCLCVCLARAAIASFPWDGCPSDCVSFSVPHCARI